MRLLLQRVRRAEVRVAGQAVGAIGPGLLVLAGFGSADDDRLPLRPSWGKLLARMVDLRIFPDAQGRLGVGLRDFGGQVLAVSQFTLYADCSRGRRPSFSGAAPPELARDLYDRMLADLQALLPGRVQGGVFGADMDVELVNWGPVTLWLDHAEPA